MHNIELLKICYTWYKPNNRPWQLVEAGIEGGVGKQPDTLRCGIIMDFQFTCALRADVGVKLRVIVYSVTLFLGWWIGRFDIEARQAKQIDTEMLLRTWGKQGESERQLATGEQEGAVRGGWGRGWRHKGVVVGVSWGLIAKYSWYITSIYNYRLLIMYAINSEYHGW